MENNTLLIIEENDKETKTSEKNPSAKLKLALANKKLKEKFFQDENEINKTTESMNEEYEKQIDESILEMEHAIGQTYSSDSEIEDEFAPSNGNCMTDDNADVSLTYGQQVPALILPFFERRRLSECKEESETDEEIEISPKPTIIITSTNGTTLKPDVPEVAAVTNRRFTVTKTKEEGINSNSNVSAVPTPSILKKTPSPPSQPKVIQINSPKKIRYEAEALRDISAEKNSHTIHFPCSSGPMIARADVKSFFSPQGILNPHLDKRYFDTSLVEVRASQNQLANSTKSLDDSNIRPLSDIWIKRTDSKQPNLISDKISVSSDSITEKSNRRVDVSRLFCDKNIFFIALAAQTSYDNAN